MRHSQNLPLPLRIYPSFQQLYATLPESTPASQNIPAFSTTICDPLRIYPFLQEYTPFSTTIILCDLPRIYLHKGYTFLKKENIPPFSTTILIMRPSQNLPAHRLCIFLKRGIFWGGEILGGSHTVVEKGGIFWKGGVDYGRVAHINWLKRGIDSGREG